MSFKKQVMHAVLNDPKKAELNEEWNNFVKRIGEVGTLVRDMASGDKAKAEAAKILADQYLEGKVIDEDNVKMTVKTNRTVINQQAFKSLDTKDTDEMDKEVWMREVGKDAQKRAAERKIRREKADTFKTMATKAFRRGEYERALSCYNKAMEHVRDDAMLYCDRALTNIKLGNYDKVFEDCHWAERINEKSFKARLYRAKAYKELEQFDKLEECVRELEDMFPQHNDLVTYFLEKKEEAKQEAVEEEEEDDEAKTDTIEI